MRAVICPVCLGSGKYEDKACHGCMGSGWVSVPEEGIHLPTTIEESIGATKGLPWYDQAGIPVAD